MTNVFLNHSFKEVIPIKVHAKKLQYAKYTPLLKYIIGISPDKPWYMQNFTMV